MHPANANDNRPAEFDKMLAACLPAVRRRARRYPWFETDDLVQSAIERALKSWRTYRVGQPMAPWLYGHIMNAAQVVVRPGGSDVENEHIPSPPQQEHVVELRQVVSVLTGRELAVMCALAVGNTLQEIGAAHGVSTERARQIVAKAREHIAERLTPRADTRRALAA